MSQWKWNDVPLEIDFGDVEFQKKYEAAFEKVAGREKELMKAGKISEISEGYCEMFFTLFDDLFGNGTSKKLFGDKKNIVTVNECYDSFLTFAVKEVERINKAQAAMSARTKKYRVKSKR